MIPKPDLSGRLIVTLVLRTIGGSDLRNEQGHIPFVNIFN